jgi:hypothetical protein
MTTDKQREAFEALYSHKDLSGCEGTNINFVTGVEKPVWCYHNRTVQALWDGYQSALASPEVQKLVDKVWGVVRYLDGIVKDDPSSVSDKIIAEELRVLLQPFTKG